MNDTNTTTGNEGEIKDQNEETAADEAQSTDTDTTEKSEGEAA